MDSNVPAGPQQIMSLLTGFARTQMLLAADELGVFDALSDHPAPAADVAAHLALPASTVERLLIACTSLGLLAKSDGRYALNEISKTFLVKSSPDYMGKGWGHFRNELYPLWGHLASAVREGQPQWGKIPGMDPRGPFESMYQSEENVRVFMETMFSMTYPAAVEYAARFDFSPYRNIVDVGGASGAFFAAVLPRFPGIGGTIFDLPAVGDAARECMERFGLAERVQFQAGDFFKDPLPQPADMYVLGFILHDWNREQGTLLLKKIYNALPGTGAVFISEALFNETKDGPPTVAFADLNMLVATYGEEHTPSEYKEWLREAGFARSEHRYCDGLKSFVVGYKN